MEVTDDKFLMLMNETDFSVIWKTQDEYCQDCTTNDIAWVWDACARLMYEEHACLGVTGKYMNEGSTDVFEMTFEEYHCAFEGCTVCSWEVD